MKIQIWTALGIFSLIALVGPGLWKTGRSARDAAIATTCNGQLCAIGTSMHHYYEKYGHFPPAYLPDASGKPAHSWRVLLLEFWDPIAYAKYDFNEPWNGPNNSKLESRMPSFYACPGDKQGRSRWRTNYFVVTGKDTLFPGSETRKLEDVKTPRDSTIMVVESIGRDVHWMEPWDLSFDSMSFAIDDKSKPSISSLHQTGPRACMVDVSRRR